jgi:hypothetical protein
LGKLILQALPPAKSIELLKPHLKMENKEIVSKVREKA